MDPNKDNANPTILNASDLPSRREASVVAPRADGSTGLFDGLVPPTASINDPFASYADSSASDSDDVEEIDSQEIYGPSSVPV